MTEEEKWGKYERPLVWRGLVFNLDELKLRKYKDDEHYTIRIEDENTFLRQTYSTEEELLSEYAKIIEGFDKDKVPDVCWTCKNKRDECTCPQYVIESSSLPFRADSNKQLANIVANTSGRSPESARFIEFDGGLWPLSNIKFSKSCFMASFAGDKFFYFISLYLIYDDECKGSERFDCEKKRNAAWEELKRKLGVIE